MSLGLDHREAIAMMMEALSNDSVVGICHLTHILAVVETRNIINIQMEATREEVVG